MLFLDTSLIAKNTQSWEGGIEAPFRGPGSGPRDGDRLPAPKAEKPSEDGRDDSMWLDVGALLSVTDAARELSDGAPSPPTVPSSNSMTRSDTTP